jgi:site-specific DNA-methyltransferase (adenine-specific)
METPPFKVIALLDVLKPYEVCTHTYLVAGCFDNKRMAENLRSYLRTKFARFLLALSISGMDISREKFRFVPLQDFSKPWTDEELYKKYDLTKDEIAFIESMIKPME